MKRRERSVKHRIHETGERSDGKSTILARICQEKHYLKNPVFPLKNRKTQNFSENFAKLHAAATAAAAAVAGAVS